MKKFLALVLAFAMVFTSIPVVFADTEVSAEAKALALLGMLEGDGGGVTVEYTSKELTRLGAAAALLKLKGLYDEAIAFQGEDNFADVKDYAWVEGRNLMAYLKANPALGFGGDEKGNFNPGAMINEQSYYKVLLETLGYKQTTAEVTGDFAWEEVFTFAESIGLMPAKVEKFTIDHLAKATFAALQAKTKDGKVYIDTLIAAGVVKEEDAIAAGLIEEKPVLEAALKSAVALGNTVVEVTFDGPVNAGAEDVTLYEIDGLTVEEAIVTGEDTVRLTTSAQEAGKKYTLTVGDVKVNFGGKAKVAGAPELKKVTGPDTERVELVFDKTLDFVTATDKANYEIKDVEIADIELDGDTVTLITNGLTANKTHTVKVTGVKSVDGVALKSASKSFYSKSDKTAPKVEKAVSDTYTRVIVTFNEELDKESAEDVSNYTINDLTVEKAVLKADDNDEYTIVELTTSPQKAGTSYTLKVSGIKDTSVLGNEITKEQSVKFTGKTQDKTGPTVSKVEVKNRNRLLVEFKDNSRLDFATLQNAENYEFNKDITVEKAELIPGYDDDTKQVILTVSDMAEKTTYKLTITGVTDEYGNEMKKTEKSINYNNKDLDAARIVKVNTKSATEIEIEFSKHIDAVTAKDVANYTINGGIGTPLSAKANSALTKVTLKVNELEDGKNYKLTVDGLMDLAGNTLKTSTYFVARTYENDIEAPEVEDITVVNEKVMRVTFSEPIEIKSVPTPMTNIKAVLDGGTVLTLGAVYENNTILEFSDGDDRDGLFKFQDIEYTLNSFENVTDKAGNAVVVEDDGITFWGNTYTPDEIDFTWEQINVEKYKLTFSEKVQLKNSDSKYTKDADYDDDLGMSTVWYLKNRVPVDKPAFKGNINSVFESGHKGILIANTEEEKENETIITNYMEDEEGPYIEKVEAIYRDLVEVTFNEDLKTYGTYEISYYDLNGKLKKVSGIPGAPGDEDNVVELHLGSKLALESRFEYTLKVTTVVQDLAGNKSEKDEVYDFQGTDLVAPGNYVKGVTFKNGSEFTVKFAATSTNRVDIAVYTVDEDGEIDELVVSENNVDISSTAEKTFTLTNYALLEGVTYRVVTDDYADYDFEGIVEDGVDVVAVGTSEYEISYSGLKSTDTVVLNGTPISVTYNDGVFVYDPTSALGTGEHLFIVYRDSVPMYYGVFEVE